MKEETWRFACEHCGRKLKIESNMPRHLATCKKGPYRKTEEDPNEGFTTILYSDYVAQLRRERDQ